MSLLRAEPERSVRSLSELEETALALHADASRRYRGLAAAAEQAGAAPAAAVLRRLAEEEKARAGEEAGDGPGPWAALCFSDEDLAATRRATPYRVLSTAVRNAERVFAFWTYVSAGADDAEIRAGAERLAADELDRVAALRRDRRLAYHAEQGANAPPADAAARADETAKALAARAAEAARRLEAAGDPAARTLAEIAGTDGSRAPGGGEGDAAGALATVRRLVLMADEALDMSFLAAEQAQSEAELDAAQTLARECLNRLARLRRLEDEVRSRTPQEPAS